MAEGGAREDEAEEWFRCARYVALRASPERAKEIGARIREIVPNDPLNHDEGDCKECDGMIDDLDDKGKFKCLSYIPMSQIIQGF